MAGEKRYGITWHLMTGRVDAGDILLRRTFDIDPDETAFSLNLKCYEAGIESFDELLQSLRHGPWKTERQDFTGRRYFDRHRRPEAAATFMWHKDAETLAATVRALDFGHYENPLGLPKLSIGNTSLIVRRAAVGATSSGAPPGTIVHADERQLQVATSSRDLSIEQLSTPEGAPVSIGSILQRFGLVIGDRLPSPSVESADRLTSLNTSLSGHESYWVKRLSELTPIAVPYAKGASSDEEPAVATVDLKLPESFVALMSERAVGIDRGRPTWRPLSPPTFRAPLVRQRWTSRSETRN